MSTVRYYRWDDAGAPSLTGQVGSLINVLRKCLVGVGGIAYGAKPAAGWTEEFIGAAANIAVFKNSGADGGCECLVRVNDNSPGAGAAREAQVIVYAAMSDVNTGTNGTAATWFNKSSVANSTARKWIVVADARTAWVYSYETGEVTNGGDNSLLGFGDLESKLPSTSAHRYFCTGRNTANQNPGYHGAFWCTTADLVGLQVANPAGTTAPLSAYGISTPYVGYRPIGGMDMAAAVDPETGDYYLQRFPPIFAGLKYVGLLRGVFVPFGNMSGLTRAELVPGSSSLVVVRGNVNNNNNNFYVFNAALDTVGPW